MLERFHVLLKVADLHKNQKDENRTDYGLADSSQKESYKFYWKLFFQKFYGK